MYRMMGKEDDTLTGGSEVGFVYDSGSEVIVVLGIAREGW